MKRTDKRVLSYLLNYAKGASCCYVDPADVVDVFNRDLLLVFIIF